jgi:hypothetical protein
MTPDQAALADFLEQFPWRAFATLTTPYKKSQAWWDSAIPVWLRAVESAERVTLGWVMSCEPQPHLHAHLLIAAMAPLECDKAGLRWLPIANTRDRDSALVLPYDPAQGARAYVCKLYGTSHDEVRFGGRLDGILGILPLRRNNSRARRTLRRIHLQGRPTKATAGLDARRQALGSATLRRELDQP